MTKEAGIYNGEKTAPSISGTGNTGQPHVKEWNENRKENHVNRFVVAKGEGDGVGWIENLGLINANYAFGMDKQWDPAV